MPSFALRLLLMYLHRSTARPSLLACEASSDQAAQSTDSVYEESSSGEATNKILCRMRNLFRLLARHGFIVAAIYDKAGLLA